MGGLAGVGFIACSRHLGIARGEAPERSNGAVLKFDGGRSVPSHSVPAHYLFNALRDHHSQPQAFLSAFTTILVAV
jgi:hypothetical protein